MSGRLEHWTEWRALCALDSCSEGTRAALHAFAAARFAGFLRRYVARTSAADVGTISLPPAQSWHLLETRFLTAQTRLGKRYKDWLFARAAPARETAALGAVEGGATLIMRDTVREFLRREYSPRHTLSLNAPCSRESGALTLQDLLPAQADLGQEVELREFRRIADDYARRFFEALTRRERIVLLARSLELPLSLPAVVRAAGCGKSALNTTAHGLVRRMQERLVSDFGGEDATSLRVLAALTWDGLGEAAKNWARLPENGCARFFIMSGDRRGAGKCRAVSVASDGRAT
jgi:hypothetical protein